MGDPAKLITSWSELPYDPQVQSMLADSNNVVPSLQFQSNFQATSPLVSENHKDAPLGGSAAAVPSLSAPPAAVPKGFDASRVTRRGAGAHLRRPSSDDPSTINQHAENLLKLSGGPASGNEYDDSPPDSPEHKPKKKRNKKRARPDSDVPDVSRVTLSREDILRISSKELEEFAARMAAEKALSPEEQREIKRQRRLIKNREYAQASRVKKKAYMGDMESRFHEFEQENYELKLQLAQANQRISELQADNTILRSKLSSSMNALQAVGLSAGSIQAPQIPSISSSQLGLPLTSSLSDLKFSSGGITSSGFLPDLFGSVDGMSNMPQFGRRAQGVIGQSNGQ